MSEPFIAEIRIFAGNFAPRGWAFCDGQLLPISQNTALFSLIGTTYGGDGRSTTGLPNLQGRAPMHSGRGPGLTSRRLGETVGVESVTLTEAQMPAHTHSMRFESVETGNSNSPEYNVYAQSAVSAASVFSENTPNSAVTTLRNTGGGFAHNNMQPYIGVNFIIALWGVYPSRS